MDEKYFLELLSGQNQIQTILDTNQKTEQFGLTLTQEDAKLLAEGRKESLTQQRRVEFGEGILPKIIYAFCDSAYISQDNYVDTMLRLQEIFYLYKNEMQDEITDDELLHFMREQFDEVCFGDVDYLEGTCLDIFAQAIRAGYRGYKESDGNGEFHKMDIVARWDYDLYLQVLQELCWR